MRKESVTSFTGSRYNRPILQAGDAALMADEDESRIDIPPADPTGREAAYDIQVELYAVLGHSKVQVKQLLKLGRGAVVELDRKINEPIDLVVNDKLVGHGEVMVVDDRLGITITDMLKSQGSD